MIMAGKCGMAIKIQSTVNSRQSTVKRARPFACGTFDLRLSTVDFCSQPLSPFSRFASHRDVVNVQDRQDVQHSSPDQVRGPVI